MSHLQRLVATTTRSKTQSLAQVLLRLPSQTLLSFHSSSCLVDLFFLVYDQFKCPFCDTMLGKKTLKAHINSKHPEKVPVFNTKKKNNNSNKPSNQSGTVSTNQPTTTVVNGADTSSTTSTTSTTSTQTTPSTITSQTQTNADGSLQSSSESTAPLQSSQELKKMLEKEKKKLKTQRRREKKIRKAKKLETHPFGCSLCKNRFTTAIGLRQHGTTMHKLIDTSVPSSSTSTSTQEHPTAHNSVQNTHAVAQNPTTDSSIAAATTVEAVTPTQ